MFEVDLGEVTDDRVETMCQNGVYGLGRFPNTTAVNPRLNNPEGFQYGRILSFDTLSSKLDHPVQDEYFIAISSLGRLWVGTRVNKAEKITWHEK